MPFHFVRTWLHLLVANLDFLFSTSRVSVTLKLHLVVIVNVYK
jgi:hypothetical protein